MNYNRIYDTIISKSMIEVELKLRYRGDGNYYEKHHIIPRCMGGLNDGIALLTAKEHFICHYLLCEMNPNNYRIRYAFWRMINGTGNTMQFRDYKISSRLYERARILIRKTSSELNKGRTPWTAGKKFGPRDRNIVEKAVATRKKNGSYYHTQETKDKMSADRLGHMITQETKDRIGSANRGNGVGRKLSIEICEKKRQSMIGKNKGRKKIIVDGKIKYYWPFLKENK